jgi:hypothetical protein
MSISNPTLTKLYGDLAAKVTAVGGDLTTIVIGDSKAVTADLTIPNNVRLRFQDDGQLAVATGVTVTINSPQHIVGDVRAKIFDLTGTGAVAFTKSGVVYPEWWGAVADGSSDDYVAIQAAASACPQGGTLAFLGGTYAISDEIDINDHMTLQGRGDIGAAVLQTSNSKAIFRGHTASNTSYVFIRDLRFRASGTGCYGVLGPTSSYYWAKGVIERCYFDAEIEYPIEILPAEVTVRDCSFGIVGTPGTDLVAIKFHGDNTTVSFGNEITHCFIEGGKGGNGCIEIGTGAAVAVRLTTIQNTDIPAIYARGTRTLRIEDCVFENVDPASGDEVIVDLAQDVSGNKVKCVWDGCRVTQGAGDTDALVCVGTGSVVAFLRCVIIGDGEYWTVRPSTSTYDTRIVRMEYNETSGMNGSALAGSLHRIVGNTTIDGQLTASSAELGGAADKVTIGTDGDVRFEGGAAFYVPRVAQATEPALGAGKMAVWRDTDDGSMWLLYNDADSGQVKIELV